MLAQGVERCRESLQRYGIPEDQFEPNWLQGKQVRYLPEEKQKLLRQDVGELFYLLARASRERSEGEIDPLKAQEQLRKAKNWNSLASNYSEKQLTVSLSTQKAELERLMKNESKAKSSLPIDLSSATLRDRYLLGYDLTREKQYREAIPHLEWVTRNDPSDFSAWFVRGSAHHELGQFDLAASCFSSALVLRSDFAPVWVNRGRSFAALKHLDAALLDLDQAVQLDPKLSEAYLQRAAIRQARRELKEAEIDLSRAIELNRETPVRLFFVRSRLRKQLNDARGAAEDLEQALARTPQDELSWVARGEHLLAKEPQAALTACDEAMKLNHRCVPALQLKVHLLSERLNRTLEAIMLLDRAVEWYPDHVPFRAGRGVLLARVGQRDRALADAEESLLRDTQPSNLYQVGCIYALTAKETPEDRFKAMELIGKALRAQFGRNLIERDSDLDPIRKTPEFKKLVELSR
jgi:tetratricopeptide (TPR) repeat protein